MGDSEKIRAPVLQLERYVWPLAAVWTMVVAASLVWNLFHMKQMTLMEAHMQAHIAYQRDFLSLRWNVAHGGIYMPVTEKTQSNPYLSHMPEHDIRTPSGKPLTLLNPAYITRQIYEHLTKEEFDIRRHTTSLNPIRTENAPDSWETVALRAFERGETEISSVEKIEAKEYLRLMHPLIIEKGCLKCHAKQGYHEGDIGGGISVSIPMTPLRAIERRYILTFTLIHSLLWLVGLCGIGWGAQRLGRDERERKRAEEELRQSREFVEVVFNSINDCLCVIDTSDFRIVGANRVFLDKYMGEEDLIGRPCYEVTHHRSKPCEPPNDLCPLQQTLRTGSHSSAEHIHYDKLGVEGYFEVLTSPIRNEKGEIGRVVHATRDITERKRAEEALWESEERYRAVVQQSVDSIFVVDGETKRIVEANAAFQHLLGYTPNEIAGLSIYDLVKADRTDVDQRFQDTLRGQGPISYERQYQRKDGSLVDVGGSASLISFGGKKAVCVIFRDTTERKRAEGALRESEERYRAIMEQSADGIYLVDADTERVIEANRALAQMLGYTREEMRGMHNHQLVAAAPEEISRRFQEILTSPSGVSFERSFRKKDGSLLELWVTAGVLFFGGKKVACGIIKDLTERKRAEEERERLINELQEALANIKTLSGLIPICAQCKKIRDDKGYWQQVEVFVRDHSEAEFTHGLCPECTKLLFPELQEKRERDNPI